METTIRRGPGRAGVIALLAALVDPERDAGEADPMDQSLGASITYRIVVG